MMFRSAIATARNSGVGAATPLRTSLARPTVRSFASSVPKAAEQAAPKMPTPPSGSSSNLPLILALGGVSGLGAWYYLGGFGDKTPSLSVPLPSGPVALDSKEFREFTLKEVRPYNHDSST